MAPSDKTDQETSGPAKSSLRRRSLRAVFAADVAGFSGRMSLNETRTVSSISEIRTLGRQALEKNGGWLFGMAGDGLFATFESAIGAVQCALDLQHSLREREHLRDMPLRIGIHLGEVLIENEIPYGETLNIAARLEALADPGSILVSGTVMDAVSARISATFEDRGVPHLKNIPRRIPTFAVSPPPARSTVDETQIGQSNLDRTTRLDRNALRNIANEQATVEIVTPAVGPVEDHNDRRHAEASPSASIEQPPAPPEPPPAPHIPAEDQSPPKPQPTISLSDRLSELVANEHREENPQNVHPDQGADEPPASLFGNAPKAAGNPPQILATAPADLERTLPGEAAAPNTASSSTPVAPTAPPSPEFVVQITKALAEFVGPFAKMIVSRHLKSNPGVFHLITLLEGEIPNEKERLSFRIRASHINATVNGLIDDR